MNNTRCFLFLHKTAAYKCSSYLTGERSSSRRDKHAENWLNWLQLQESESESKHVICHS